MWEEKEILEAFKKGELKPVNDKKLKNQIIEAAKNMDKKSKHISVRISEYDLLKIKEKAIETGIPYQTLIGSVLHQYAEGKVKISI